jgi:hypothetical protein
VVAYRPARRQPIEQALDSSVPALIAGDWPISPALKPGTR